MINNVQCKLPSTAATIAALVTAKGTNTLSHKHLIQVLGHPLIWYPLIAAKNCIKIDRHYISSDDTDILAIGKKVGYRSIIRPTELALPESLHVDTIRHALHIMKTEDNYEPDILVVLMGNTVFIKSDWIDQSLQILRSDENLSAVVPVYQDQDHHPFRAKCIDKDGLLEPYFDFGTVEISTNRQALPANYFLCHNFWTLRVSKSIYTSAGQKPWTFMGDKVYPLMLEEAFDVHVQTDLLFCENWLISNKKVSTE